MSGRIKQLLGKLSETRGRGAAGAHFLRTHLILKGITPPVAPRQREGKGDCASAESTRRTS